MSEEELQAELDEQECKLGELCFEWRLSGAEFFWQEGWQREQT